MKMLDNLTMRLGLWLIGGRMTPDEVELSKALNEMEPMLENVREDIRIVEPKYIAAQDEIRRMKSEYMAIAQEYLNKQDRLLVLIEKYTAIVEGKKKPTKKPAKKAAKSKKWA